MIGKLPSYFGLEDHTEIGLIKEEAEACCNTKCQESSGCAPGVNNWTRTVGISIAK